MTSKELTLHLELADASTMARQAPLYDAVEARRARVMAGDLYPDFYWRLEWPVIWRTSECVREKLMNMPSETEIIRAPG
jgi:hypothetical protein